MRIFLTLCLLLFSLTCLADGPVIQTTPITRQLLRASDAGTARSVLGVLATNNWPVTNVALYTPTITGGTQTGGTFSGGTNNADVIGGAQTNSINVWSSNNAANVVLSMIVTNLASDIWVSPSNSVADRDTGIILGSGTRLNPYYGDFDAIMTNNFSFKTVHLLQGLFACDGYAGYSSNFSIWPGESLIGSGRNLTVISNAQIYSATTTTLYGNVDNAKISDLTVDCNLKTSGVYNGITLTGNNDVLENVTVERWGGLAGGGEGFAVILGKQGATGLRVRGCVITNDIGTYDTGYALSGTVFFTENEADMQIWTNAANGGGFECGDGWPQGSTIINNHFNYGWSGFYLDTATCSNILLCNNSFVSNFTGPFFNCGDINGIQFQNNSVILNPNPPATATNASRAFFSVLQNSSNVDNILISGNTFLYGPGGNYGGNPNFNGLCQGISFFPASTNMTMKNLVIVNNIVGTNSGSVFSYYGYLNQTISGMWFRDNVDQNGNPYLNNGLQSSADPGTVSTSYTTLASLVQNLNQNIDPSDGLNSGLIYDVSFNEGAGTNVYNYANSYGLFGTAFMTNGYIVGPVNWLGGQCGYALLTTNGALDHTSPGPLGSMTNCVWVPNNVATQLSGASNFTIQVVCQQPAFTAHNPTPFFGGYQSGANPWFALWFTTGAIGFSSVTTLSNNYYGITYSTTDVSDGNYHAYTYAWNGITMVLYIDGASATSWSFPGSFQTITSADYAALDAMMNGSVNSVKIWNRTLNANEVKLAYRKFFSP